MKKLSNPNSQISMVLYELINMKTANQEMTVNGNKIPAGAITVADFMGYPRISEYIRVLRKKYNLDIETIMIKFTTQFGTKSEYASYKLISETKFAIEVFEKIISK